MVFVIGLTGGIGSGKTAVSDRFESLGITIADADVAARTVVEKGTPALSKIEAHFGAEILTSDAELDRAKLREIVFNQPDQRKWLESVTIPAILGELKRILDSAESPYAILMLSSGRGQSDWIDRNLVVDVSPQTQVQRAMARDLNSREQIEAIMKVQPSRQERLDYADDIIENEADLSQLYDNVARLHQQYLECATSARNR